MMKAGGKLVVQVTKRSRIAVGISRHCNAGLRARSFCCAVPRHLDFLDSIATYQLVDASARKQCRLSWWLQSRSVLACRLRRSAPLFYIRSFEKHVFVEVHAFEPYPVLRREARLGDMTLHSSAIYVGAHSLRCEFPDVCFVRYVDDLSVAEVKSIFEHFAAFAKDKPRIFALVDISRIGRIPAAARKTSVEATEALPSRGVAIFGGSFPQRAIVNLISKAATLLQAHTDNPTRFFATENDARQWIDARRKMLVDGLEKHDQDIR
jgi:hypothetical protein